MYLQAVYTCILLSELHTCELCTLECPRCVPLEPVLSENPPPGFLRLETVHLLGDKLSVCE